MHSLANVALALVLFAARPAQGETPAPPAFIDAAAVVEGLVVEMRYFGDDNFVGARIDGYERARCLLSAPAASALAAIARDLAARGLGLKVFDCYRPSARWRISCAGRSGSTILSASLNSIPTSPSATCSSKGTSPNAPRIPAARPSISRWCGARMRASSTWARRSISSAPNHGLRIRA